MTTSTATNSNRLELAKARVLLPAGLDENNIDSLMSRLLGPSIDAADIYFQLSRHESWSIVATRVSAYAPSAGKKPDSPIPIKY